MWIYELPSTPLKADDFIEYWLYGERNGVGYFTNHAIKLKGDVFINFDVDFFLLNLLELNGSWVIKRISKESSHKIESDLIKSG